MIDASLEVAEVIAREMGDILAVPPLLESDDFFLCGGDSLRAVELINRLVSRYQPGGPPADSEGSPDLGAALLLAAFDEATPRGLAAIIVKHIEPQRD